MQSSLFDTIEQIRWTGEQVFVAVQIVLNMFEETMITAGEATKMLGISPQTIYDLAAPRGPIPCYRFGKKCIRFEPADIREYAAKCYCHPVVRNASVASMLPSEATESEMRRRFASMGYHNISIKPIARKQK